MGVTKGAAGSPEVARAMLRGGVAALGDSRLVNGPASYPCRLSLPIANKTVKPLIASQGKLAFPGNFKASKRAGVIWF